MDGDDDEAYWSAIENSPEFIASIARARADVAAGRVISHEQLLRDINARSSAD